MGKNKHPKSSESGKQAGKTGNRPGHKKRDGKPRKQKEEDHLQQIPFRLRQIMKSKERMKIGASETKKLRKAAIAKIKTDSSQVKDIPVPHFKRKKRETERAYVQRMENEARHVLFLTKNQLDRKPELEEEEEEQGKPGDKGKSDKKKQYDKGRLQRLQQKKLDRQEDKLEKDMFVDKVDFGDVAMAPPSLNVKPRKAATKSQGAPKELLLNSMLGHTAASTAKPSMARQRIMEEERLRVVEAYRHLKKQKQQQKEAQAAGLEKLKNLQ